MAPPRDSTSASRWSRARDLGLERAGGDGRQVGLEQHVVDRAGAGAGRWPRRRSARSPAATCRPLGGRPPAPLTPEHRGLVERRGDEVGEDGGPARSQPADPLHQRRRRPSRRRAPRRRAPRPARAAPGARASSASPLDSSGASAFHDLPAASREPTSDGTRLLASQPPTSRAQRSAIGRPDQTSNSSVGSHDGVPSASAASAISPADRATSTTRAAPGLVDVQLARDRLEVAHCQAAAAQHARRLDAPVVEQQLHPAYDVEGGARRRVRATSAASRCDVARSGTSSTGSVVVRPPRRASPTSPGRTTEPPSRGTSRRRLISSSAGRARPRAGDTVRRAAPVVPSPPWASTWRSSAVAAGLSSASRAVDLGGRGRLGARRAAGRWPDPAGRASRRPRRSARGCRRAPPRPAPGRAGAAARPRSGPASAWTIEISSAEVVCPATSRASSTESSRRSRPSRARWIDERVAAREASCEES